MIGNKKYKDHVQNQVSDEELREAEEVILGDRETTNEEISTILSGECSSHGRTNNQDKSISSSETHNRDKDDKTKGINKTEEQPNSKDEQVTTTPTIIIPNKIRSSSELLWDEIENGINGKNSGIPMGFNRLNKYLGLRRSIFTIVGGLPGTGKTAFVDSAYVLNPYDWYLKNKHTSKVKFEVLYYSMERKKTYKLAKWLAMRIWNKEGILIPVEELLSWTGTLSTYKRDLAKFYIDNYITEMMESGIITILDGPQNPTGIYKHMRNHALSKGTIHEVNEFEKIYISNDDNLITNVVADHVGKIRLEKIGDQYNKKANIDKLSEYFGWAE